MEIYIEDFIIQNSLINFCLLKLIEITTKSKTNIFKLIALSLFGATFSIISILFITNSLLINILKVICSSVMLLIAYKQSIKQYVFNFILLFIYTYAFIGSIIGIWGINAYTNSGFITNTNISLTSVCFIILALTFIFKFTTKHISFLFKSNNLIYKIKLYKDNKSIKVNAYLDTGNFLNHNGQPVIVLDIETFCKLMKINLIDFYLLKSEKIKTNTVNGCSNLKLFKLDKLELNIKNKSHIITNVFAAINLNANFKNNNYNALLSPMLF